ncbi:MAG TPA: hypothetical protein VLI55_16205 [Bryobacteraceae bacterium]|nr:hypothetical protein [Bryobacteraceae bacterium]
MQVETVAQESISREKALQRLVTAFISAGLAFLILPGTFLGVWNLIAISSSRSAHFLSSPWIQAHGQAQIFGWIGTFVIGIGFYSLSKMGRLAPFAVRRGWQSWVLWVAGVSLRWMTGIYGWHWRIMLPVSAALQLAGFLLFFWTVRKHKPSEQAVAAQKPRPAEVWMRLVIASTFGFLGALLLNLGAAVCAAFVASGPALPPSADRHLLLISAWAFLVVSVWGFNARWLPVFLGLPQPHGRGLLTALAILIAGVITGLADALVACGVLLLAACVAAILSLHIFQPSVHPPKLNGIHPSFPYFVRGAYVWLLIAAALSICAPLFDRNGGIGGASRHALTVGFLATMVFAIGQRVLPAFCGMRVLFSKRLMLGALALLNAGCLLRVTSEIPAYEHNFALAWNILPVSAVIELTAVALFATNLAVTFLRPPAHLAAPSSPLVSSVASAK